MEDTRKKSVKNDKEPIVLDGILGEFREALEEEIEKIKTSGQSSTLLSGGRRIESQGPEYWYRFGVEYVPSLPADTPCKLVIGKDQFDVTVVSFEESFIIISSKVLLPDTIGSARLENGTTVLMERLIKCIEDNAKNENVVGKRMLPDENTTSHFQKLFSHKKLPLLDTNTDSQNQAIISALSNDITYIWGPPGTGKTTVIGQIIDLLFQYDRSVLVVSHTNTAVDGAIEKANESYSKKQQNDETDYPILRLGVPTRPLPEKVLLRSHVAELGKELFAKKAELESREADLHIRINEILPLLAKYKWITTTKLPEIQKFIDAIIEHEDNITRIQKEINGINGAIQLEKAAHPEYGQFLVLARRYKAKQTEYDSICSELSIAEQASKDLDVRIQCAADEIKKHEKYSELRAQEKKYMSERFIRGEISKTSSQISKLKAEIYTVEAKRKKYEEIIEEYAQKGPVAKLLAGKSAVTHAQAGLRDTDIHLPEVKEALQRQEKMAQEYKTQLEQLLLLQEQMKAVIPSKTKEHWEDIYCQQKEQYDRIKQTLPELIARRENSFTALQSLEEQQNYAKKSFDFISELGRKQRHKHDALVKANAEIERINGSCAEQLEQERLMCSAFYYAFSGKTLQEIFDELSLLIATVKENLSAVDISAIQQERELADAELVDIVRQKNELKQKMQELEKQAIANAKIVGATLAKSYLSDALHERKFDTVILDEASMASIPALWCASYLAEKNIVIVGDFLQLPPIVIADTPMAQKWLGMDIFYHSGMQELAKDKPTCPENFVMLNDQFRMESDIASIANMYYGAYGGLRSNDTTQIRVNARNEFYEWYSGKRTRHNTHLIDTESLHAWVTGVPQGKSHSRLNCFSAAVDVDLAFKLLENKLNALDAGSAKPEKNASVLIVAPYKPHIARINQLIDLEYRNRGFKENLNLIRAGTIHSFQGSEADIVIFDLVIDEPHWKANLFMTDKSTNDDLRKMFNVAVTRAKFKLFVVGNFAYCRKRAKNNALSELLDKLLNEYKLEKIDAKAILPDIAFVRKNEVSLTGKLSGKHIVCREEAFNDYFMADLLSFERRMIIYSPFITENRLSVLLPVFADAVAAGKQIVVVTKDLSDRGKSEVAQYRKCEQELSQLGVSVLHKKGMHEKLIFVDDTAVWIGSLNALSFTGLTGEVMQRHADKALTAEYEKLFDIPNICDAIQKQYEQKCPGCGNEMAIGDGPNGGFYWACGICKYIRFFTQPYPTDGIIRCKCGAPYVFSMKNEPRWVCSKDPKHYQKMQRGDLALEKMAALIPTKKARKEVDRFFEQKQKRKKTTKSPIKGKKAKSAKKNANIKASVADEELEQMKLF